MITSRIPEYLENKGVRIYKAEENSGISNGTLAKSIRDKSHTSTQILDKILNTYPDI